MWVALEIEKKPPSEARSKAKHEPPRAAPYLFGMAITRPEGPVDDIFRWQKDRNAGWHFPPAEIGEIGAVRIHSSQSNTAAMLRVDPVSARKRGQKPVVESLASLGNANLRALGQGVFSMRCPF